MASGKRASMREGPLSALFRKTEEAGLEPDETTPEPPSRPTSEVATADVPTTGLTSTNDKPRGGVAPEWQLMQLAFKMFCTSAAVGLSYGMPTYRVGDRRLHVAAWKHGVSFYGWGDGGGFLERHPGLHNGKGTIRVRPSDAEAIPDQEFLELIRAALDRRE